MKAPSEPTKHALSYRMTDARYWRLRQFVQDWEQRTKQRMTHQAIIDAALDAMMASFYEPSVDVRSGDQQPPTKAKRGRKPTKGKKPIQRRGTSIPISAAELEAAGGDKRRAYRARRAQKKQQQVVEKES